MTDFILHHYPMSPFAEKIRVALGVKKLAWKSVIIPRIMPKPDVIALTGGYRKTPILQIGADIYCDTTLIARTIEKLAPTPSLYPPQQAVATLALSQWVDSVLFNVAVRHVFQPANLTHMFPDAAELETFTKDRAAMRANATTRRISELEAFAIAHTFLRHFDAQLAAGTPYATGTELSIADLSVYHCLWFMRRAPLAAKLLEPYANVLAWMQRIANVGKGSYSDLSSSDAIEIARRATPAALAPQDAGSIKVGDAVQVLPTDYGIDPTPGTLVTCNDEEIAIRRVDPRAGEVIVHFPRMNYELRKAA